jgi:hypothetical protein
MDSDQISRWLSLVANVGVLIGLVFVGIEVRNSSNAITAQSAQAVADGYNQYNYLTASDPEIARIAYLGLRDPEKLTDAETVRAAALMRGLFNHYRQVHTLFESGAMSEKLFTSSAKDINRVIQLPGSKIFLSGYPMFSDQFFEDVRTFGADEAEDVNSLGRGIIDFN